jgi:hypothetical protein
MKRHYYNGIFELYFHHSHPSGNIGPARINLKLFDMKNAFLLGYIAWLLLAPTLLPGCRKFDFKDIFDKKTYKPCNIERRYTDHILDVKGKLISYKHYRSNPSLPVDMWTINWHCR